MCYFPLVGLKGILSQLDIYISHVLQGTQMEGWFVVVVVFKLESLACPKLAGAIGRE